MNPMQRRPRWAARAMAGLAMVVALMPLTSFGGAAHADDPLDQKVSPDQAQGTGQVVRDAGHVDFGPTLNTGRWAIEIHDDTAVPSFWRLPSDVVMKVNDAAIKQVPDGDGYAFLGQEPGADVWIIPQVQAPGVIWAGWNTQEPTVLDTLSRGATLRVLGVQGPGDLTVYLQNGNFGDVTVLWSSRQPFPQDSWIEVNTHTHANWVFDSPGIYLVEIEIDGTLVSGETVTARDALRFSVGDSTDPQAAFGMSFDQGELPGDPAPGTTLPQPPAESGDQGLSSLLWISVGAVVVVLLAAVVVVVVTTGRAKARARAAGDRREQA